MWATFGSRYWKMNQVIPKQTQANHIISHFLKAVFHKFYLVHSWIPWPIYIKRALVSLIKFTKFWKTKCTPEAILCSKSNTSIWFCEADLCWILKRRKLRNGFIFRWNHYRKLWWIEVCCYFNFNFFL